MTHKQNKKKFVLGCKPRIIKDEEHHLDDKIFKQSVLVEYPQFKIIKEISTKNEIKYVKKEIRKYETLPDDAFYHFR